MTSSDHNSERDTKEHEAIHNIDRAILSSMSSAQQVLQLIINLGLQYTVSQHGQIVVDRRGRLVVEASSEQSRVGEELPMDRSLCGRAFREGRDLFVEDVSALPAEEYVRFHDETRSELALIIRPAGVTRILGVLNLERFQKAAFDDAPHSFARVLAGQAAIAIEKAREVKTIEALLTISTELLRGELSAGRAYQAILETVLEALNLEHGQILFRDQDELIIIASSRQKDIGLRVDAVNSICGRYLLAEQGREILRLDDIPKSKYSEYYLALLHSEEGRRMSSEMVAPFVENGRIVGALNLESPQVGAFSVFDEKLVALFRELVQPTLVAAVRRTHLATLETFESGRRAMTLFSFKALDFLHQFHNGFGHTKANLIFIVDKSDELASFPIARGQTLGGLIDELVASLDGLQANITEFAGLFRPNAPEYQPQAIDLKPVCVEVVNRYRSRVKDIDVVFANRLPEEKGPAGAQVRARSVCFLTPEIRNVLASLIDNAITAIRRRREAEASFVGGRVVVELDLPEPLYARVRVIDDGIGVPQETRERIFDHGYSSEPGGSGLGLSLCRSYVSLFGGKIHCKSDSASGTVFELSLPALFGEVAEAAP